MVDEHNKNGKTMADIARDKSMQKIRETKSKMRKSHRKSKRKKSKKNKKRITSDILEGLKLENQRTSLMIANTKRFSDGLEQTGVRSSMMIKDDISTESENEDQEIEVCLY